MDATVLPSAESQLESRLLALPTEIRLYILELSFLTPSENRQPDVPVVNITPPQLANARKTGSSVHNGSSSGRRAIPVALALNRRLAEETVYVLSTRFTFDLWLSVPGRWERLFTYLESRHLRSMMRRIRIVLKLADHRTDGAYMYYSGLRARRYIQRLRRAAPGVRHVELLPVWNRPVQGWSEHLTDRLVGYAWAFRDADSVEILNSGRGSHAGEGGMWVQEAVDAAREIVAKRLW